jgi:hypothetical protein
MVSSTQPPRSVLGAINERVTFWSGVATRFTLLKSLDVARSFQEIHGPILGVSFFNHDHDQAFAVPFCRSFAQRAF